MIEWRKMSDAPQDRDVLIYDPNLKIQSDSDLKNKGVVVAEFSTLFNRWWIEGGGFPTPICWAYLPKPPKVLKF